MESKGILGFLEDQLNKGLEAAGHSAKELSGYNQMARDAEEITRSLGLVYREQSPLPLPKDKRYGDVLPASYNAIAHAYMSAKLAQKYGVPAAKTFGNLREWVQSPGNEKALAAESWDVYKDMWNNEVGRRIGSSLSMADDAALIEAIKDAWRKGDMIAVRTDARLPKDYRYSLGSVLGFDERAVRMKSRLPDPRPRSFSPW